jgi:hypothetical protein
MCFGGSFKINISKKKKKKKVQQGFKEKVK